jgi:endonuclease/exonuclease/phosphatase family metal-dependent hydrolase
MPRLRAMTYNVRYFGHGTRGLASTRTGLRRIAEAVADITPHCDVIALQEVEAHSLRSSLVTWSPDEPTSQLTEWMRALDRALEERGVAERYEAHYFAAHRYTIAPGTYLYTTGLAMLVGPRLEVVSEDASPIEDITHRRGATALKQTRICAHLALRLRSEHRDGLPEPPSGGADLDVFNTHLSLPGPFYPEFWRGSERMGHGPNQRIEASKVVDAIRARRRSSRVLLMGDFNSLPGSPVDRQLQAAGDLVDGLGVTRSLTLEQLSDWATAGFLHVRMAIDRIYASRAVRFVDFDGSVPFEDTSPFDGLSDHVPLVARFELA